MFTGKTIEPLMNKDVFVFLAGFEQDQCLRGHIIDFVCDSSSDHNIINFTFKYYKNSDNDLKSVYTTIINPFYVICIEECEEKDKHRGGKYSK